MTNRTRAGQIAERRSYGRVSLRVLVSVWCNDLPGFTSSGFSRDVSNRGIYLFTECALREGSFVELRMALPSQLCTGREVVACIHGYVKRSEHYPDGKAGAAVEIQGWGQETHLSGSDVYRGPA